MLLCILRILAILRQILWNYTSKTRLKPIMIRIGLNGITKKINRSTITWLWILLKRTSINKDFDDAMKKFISHTNLSSLKSSLRNIARQNQKVKIFTNEELAKNSQVVNHLKREVKVFKPMSGYKANFDANSKSYFEHCNWDMLMLFSTKGIELGGFPNIMREFCEIIHWGTLARCNMITFYDAMKKYFNIQQRWGV